MQSPPSRERPAARVARIHLDLYLTIDDTDSPDRVSLRYGRWPRAGQLKRAKVQDEVFRHCLGVGDRVRARRRDPRVASPRGRQRCGNRKRSVHGCGQSGSGQPEVLVDTEVVLPRLGRMMFGSGASFLRSATRTGRYSVT